MSKTKSPEELSYSRPLDVHTWSDYPEVNSFVNQIYSEHFADPLSEIRKKHLKVILLDLYVAWSDDPKLCTAVHMNDRKYKAKTRYNSIHISKTIINVVKILTNLGLVYFHPGFNDRRKGGASRVSRIWPSETLTLHFRKARFSILEIDYHEERECIVLRDEAKKDIEYEDTPETVRMRNILSAYNRLLRRTHIDCSHLDKAYILKKNGSRVHISQSRNFIRRIFNNSSWTQGGRFYGGWWQQISGDNRSGIRINGKRTIEIDYSGIHIVLLYARLGINYFDEHGYNDDPYEIRLPAINDPELTRWLAKNTFLMALNAINEDAAFGAVQKVARESGSIPNGGSLTTSFLKEILDQLKDKHPKISTWLCSGAGIALQYTDSQITEKIIEYFTSIDVPVLCVHDSYVIDEDYADALHEQMLLAWDHVTNLDDTHRDFLEKFSPQETKVKQLGYTDERLFDDPKGHEEITKMKDLEYVSPRYIKSLKEFKKWREKKRG